MRGLSQSACGVFEAAYQRAKAAGGHIRFGEPGGAMMPLSVEIVGGVFIGESPAELVSFAHYYEQNGDLMRDPDMVFARLGKPTVAGQWFAWSFQQDSFGTYQEVWQSDDGRYYRRFRPALMRSLSSFATTWARNLKAQFGKEMKGAHEVASPPGGPGGAGGVRAGEPAGGGM